MADLIIRDRNGEEVTYEGVEKVKFNTADGGTQLYSEGDTVENMPIILNFSGGSSEKILFKEQEVNGFAYDESFDTYGNLISPVPFALIAGETYFVKWDENVYECVAQDVSAMSPGTIAIGNISAFTGGAGNNEPFIIGSMGEKLIFLALDAQTSHRIKIYQETVSEGNQTVEAPSGYLVKSAVIAKPENLTPENIREGETVAGIEGTLPAYEVLENVPITLNFSAGNQAVTVPDGNVVKSAIIQQPETLIPENIAEGIDIAGIIGSLVAEKPTVLQKKISYVGAGDVIFSAEELAKIGFTISSKSFLAAFPAGTIYANSGMSGKLILAMVLANGHMMYSGASKGGTNYSGFVISTIYGSSGVYVTQNPTFNGITYANRLSIAKSDLPYYDSTDGTIKFTGGGAYCFEKMGGSAEYIFMVGNWP